MERGLKLLIVDDDATMRRAMARLFEAQFPGCTAVECGDGIDAVRLLAGGGFDCALLDYRIPGLDGLEVLHAARSAGVGTPVVVLTGEGSEELAVEMMKAGATDYLVKGRATPETLARTVRLAVRVGEAEARAAAARAEQAASEERFRRLVEVAEDGVWVLDAGGRTTFVNAGAAALIGYRPEELIGRSPLDFIEDDASRAATVAGMERRRQGFRERRECVMRHRDGSPVWTTVAAAPLAGPGGEYAGAFAVLSDVTRQKRTERALRESEQRFRKIFEEGPVGMGLVGMDHRIIAANAALGRMLGREPEALVGARFEEITHPEDVSRDVDHFVRLARGEIPGYQLEKRYLRADGGVVWGALTVSMISDAAGRPAYFLGMVEDVTERRAAAEALRASEARFRSLFELSPLAIELSVDGVALYANPAYLRMFGFDRAGDVIGTRVVERVAPSVRGVIADRIARRDRGEPVPESYETIGVRRDGTEFPLHLRVTRMMIDEGMAHLAFITDLTEQKEAEAARIETSRTLAGVFAASPLAIAVLDRAGYVRMWNPAAERTFGWSEEEVVGRMFPLVTAADDPDQFDDLHARLLSGRAFAGIEGSVRRKGGGMVDISASAAPLKGADGSVSGIVVVCADMTEANRLRGQLVQAQKMESLGRLAGGIAHDFNNLLAVIGGYAESVRRRVGEGHAARPQVEEIERAAERGARLVKQLLAFSRSKPPAERPGPVDVSAVVAEVCQMLGQVIGRKVVIERRGDDRPAWVEADAGQVEQILVNLALNARDAMPGGGTLTFETSHLEVPAVAGSHPAGRFVALVVRDTGKGMDASTQSRAFEPFFTTKAEGTGLGLSIVYGVVQQLGGHISMHSEPGKGTRFEILVPAATGGDA